MHWVSAAHAMDAEVRLYAHLFDAAEPGAKGDLSDDLNPNALEVLENCKLEPSLAEAGRDTPVQFERLGYFYPDLEMTADAQVFNRTMGLRDTWARVKAKG